MIDNYMKYIENIITPKTYSVHNIKNQQDDEIYSQQGKILSKLRENEFKEKSAINQSLHSKNTISVSVASPSSPLVPRTELRQSSSKSILSPHKLEEESKMHRSQNNSFSGSHIQQLKNCDDVSYLKEIIKEEKKKNMNLRHEIAELNKYIQVLNNKESEFNKTIHALKIEKEMNSKYILKMETMIYNLNKNQIKQKTLTAKNLCSMNASGSINLLMQEEKDSDKIFKNLMEELHKLKNFKTEIFKISITQDEVNSNIIKCMREIQEMFNELNISINESSSPHNRNKPDIRNMDKIKNYFETTMNNFEKSLNLKQEELVFLLGEKEREISILNDEILSLKDNLANLKNDRLKDQRIIEELETDFLIQNAKFEEMNKMMVNLEKEKIIYNDNSKKNLMKKIEPIKKSVNRSLTKLKNNLNMNEYSNVKLVESIHSQVLR